MLVFLSIGIILDAVLRIHNHSELEGVNGKLIICLAVASLLVNLVKVRFSAPTRPAAPLC